MTPEEEKALKDENERLKTENAQFKAESEAAKKSARETEIKTLFAAIGREYSEEKAKPYFEFNAEQFKTISADLLAQKGEQKPNLPAHLFGTQAKDGSEEPKDHGISFSAIYQQRNG
jgi:hypothetical protein